VSGFRIAETSQEPANDPSMSLASSQPEKIDGAPFRLGVVAARFNPELVDGLLDRVTAGLRAAGVKAGRIDIHRVPGSHEVPWAIARLATRGRYDCLVALGVLVGGDTNHHELVGQSVSHALQRVAVDRGIPVINGVIVTDTLAQARARCVGRVNRGAEFAHGALAMAALHRRLGGKS
jgi:6,7-dimethyl-8-ribityllumazine synthase